MSKKPNNPLRTKDLATIHMAKNFFLANGTFPSDADYRAMLWAQCRVTSAAELDHAGRKKVIAHLQSLGFKPAQTPRPVRKPLTSPQKLIWSLWQQLADAGAIKDRRMPGLMAYVTRQTGVERLEWLQGTQEQLVIESLKQWLERIAGAQARK